VTRRGPILAVLACAAALVAPAFALPIPKSVAGYLLGPKMIRAEIFVQTRDGVQHDFRLDRGRLLRRYAKNQLTLIESDGATTPVKVASSANVLLNGRPSNLRALRPGMQIAISRDRDLPADSVWASAAKTAPKLPLAVASFVLGNRLVTAEIVVQSAVPNAPHDYLLDRGRIRQVGLNTLTVRKIDGTVKTIPVSPTAHVKLDGQDASFAQLRRGMMVTTMHDGDTQPADQIFASGK
jgi:hypothetical protein